MLRAEDSVGYREQRRVLVTRPRLPSPVGQHLSPTRALVVKRRADLARDLYIREVI